MSEKKLTLTYLGKHWHANGDLFTMLHADGRQARVYVDSLGETWVAIRRIPEGGFFHSELVEAFRALDLAEGAERTLREQGFDGKRIARNANRVRERGI